MEQDKKNHPGTSAVLSFIFNGLGQLYNGQIFKGLVIISLSAVSMLVFIISSIFIALWLLGKITSVTILIWGIALFLVSLVSICITGIYSIFDAYRVAVKK